jgi:hypothetical protein
MEVNSAMLRCVSLTQDPDHVVMYIEDYGNDKTLLVPRERPDHVYVGVLVCATLRMAATGDAACQIIHGAIYSKHTCLREHWQGSYISD